MGAKKLPKPKTVNASQKPQKKMGVSLDWETKRMLSEYVAHHPLAKRGTP